ncbi:MAG: hypothetical protein GC168_18050 [Candidatus Hydrogenedens sp.]|nr:hypothetical protein [Candidatus Hydrogenedens sp.]
MRALAPLLVVCAGLLAYANTFDGHWVWDDASSVLLHEHVQAPARVLAQFQVGELDSGEVVPAFFGAFAQLFREDQHAFGRGEGNFYRPLLSVTFAIDYLLTVPASELLEGQAPSNPGVLWFHAQSLLWHVLAALGLLAVLRRLGAPPLVVLAVPLLWVLHPLHTEAVAYISGRADMMSGTFVFWGLYFALGAGSGARGIASIAASAACFVLGLCSKEATLIFPVVLVPCVLLRQHPESTTKSIARFIPVALSFVILGGYIFLRSTVLKFAEAGASQAAPLGQRLVETVQSFGYYIGLLFWPVGLHMERTLEGAGWGAALFGGLCLAALIALAVVAALRGQRRITLAVAWFLLTWLPISGVFPLNAPLAEHWMYVPMAGFWWAVFECLALIPTSSPLRAAGPALATMLVVVFLSLTVLRNADWHSNERLFLATLRENPETVRVHYNLAVTYGDLDHETAAAERHYKAVVKLRGGAPTDDNRESQLSLGLLALDAARPIEALPHFAAVLQDPASAEKGIAPEAWLGAFRAAVAAGDLAAAMQQFASPLAQNPALVDAAGRFIQGAPLTESPDYPGLLP